MSASAEPVVNSVSANARLARLASAQRPLNLAFMTASSALICRRPCGAVVGPSRYANRSEEHTSELQSHLNLVCRLLLEKKKKWTAEHTSCLPPAVVFVVIERSSAANNDNHHARPDPYTGCRCISTRPR